MKRYYILICLLSFFVSCEQEEGFLPLSEVVRNEPILKQVTQEFPAYDVVMNAFYETDGRVKTVYRGNLSTPLLDHLDTEFIYNESNQLLCQINHLSSPGECRPSIEYTDGQVSGIRGFPITYDGNIITNSFAWSDSHVKYEFEDDTYQRLLKVEYLTSVSSSSPSLISRDTYTYEGDNLMSIECRLINDVGGGFDVVLFIEYSYDDQPNPFLPAFNQNALIAYHKGVMPNIQYKEKLVFRSANNIVTKTTTFPTSGEVSTVNYSYDYNDRGYPVQRTHSVGDNTFYVKYEYNE